MCARRTLLCAALLGVAVVAVPATAHAASDIPHASEECIKILEAGGEIDDCQEAPNPILPETNELVWGGLAFVVLLVLMWKFGLPPVRQMMKTREDRIRADLERAEQARTDAETALAEYRSQLAEARSDALRIVEEARADAERVRRERIDAIEGEIAELRTRAAEDVRLATERAMSELRGKVAALSIELAEKVVEHNLDRATQEALIERYIDQVGSNGRG